MKHTCKNKTTALATTSLLAVAIAVPVSAAPASISASGSASAVSAAASSKASTVENSLVNVAGFKSASNFKAFYANLQRAVAKGDKTAVAARVHYPLTVFLDDDDDDQNQKLVIKTKAQFLNNYNRIFIDDVRENLAETSFSELLVNWKGAAIDDGDIWITPSKSGMPGISTVNADD